jgi:hypothetical protein
MTVMDSKQEKILKAYISYYKKNKAAPSVAAMTKLGYQRDMIRYHFGNITELGRVAREMYPESFFDEAVTAIITNKEHKAKIQDWAKSYKKFVITSAITGCFVDKKFLSSIENYCKRNKAKLLVLTCTDRAKSGDIEHVDKALMDLLITGDIYLNNNLFISSIKIPAKQTDPSTTVVRIGHKSGSVIYASPKQRLNSLATASGKLPLITLGTGAITIPDYRTDHYKVKSTEYKAEMDHIMGAIICEVKNEEFFYFRHIQAEKSGAFIDLDTKYKADGKVEKVSGGAFVLGDWHSGSTDPKAAKCWKEVSDLVKPRYIVLHDVFDGASISPHETNNLIVRARKAENNKLSLEDELEYLTKDIDMLSKWADDILVVWSNHDDWLYRYIKDGRFLNDPQNLRISFKLGSAIMDGWNPLEYATKELYKSKASNIRWLTANSSFKYAKYELACHGHIGSNGSKGSLKALERAFGKCISGHTHTSGMLRDAVQVGTSTYLELEYTKGPSSWLQSSCVVHPNGSRQLIHCIEGSWRL